MAEQVEAKIRGLSQTYADGRERQEIWVNKRRARPLPHADGFRVPICLVIGDKIYHAGIRSTAKNRQYVQICPDLKDEQGREVSLAKALGHGGFQKNQSVVLVVDGNEVRVLPTTVCALGTVPATPRPAPPAAPMAEDSPISFGIVDQETIRAAFQKHFEVHASKPRAWDIPYHVGCWGLAYKAFHQRSFSDFRRLYDELRGKWQVFRPEKNPPPAEDVYEQLTKVPTRWSQRRLSEIDLQDCAGAYQLLNSLAEIKPTGSGPSIVAISKFLHFVNPSLFIIVDRGVIWSSVLGRSWLWKQVADWRRAVASHLPGVTITRPGNACDPASYVAVLQWAGDMVRRNPGIPTIFAEYVGAHAGGRELPPGLLYYQAAAVEWFLLGLVELPPVHLQIQ